MILDEIVARTKIRIGEIKGVKLLSIVKEELGETPILLLDDFMSELDEKRRTNFLENIQDCQVIITCTDDIKLTGKVQSFYVESGNVYKK